MERLKELELMVSEFGTAPTICEMPMRTLKDKGIDGPTSAHVIEEIHTPLNFSYITFTTGSTAFQNIVGIVPQEIQSRTKASENALNLANIQNGETLLVTYPPLVNVFPYSALTGLGIKISFLKRSERDSFLLSLLKERPEALIGESSFIRAALEDAVKMGLKDLIPHGVKVLAAGTPLDEELMQEAAQYGWQINDLYGCQEFGWLALNGVLLRDDISLIPSPEGEQYREVTAGGLPTGDSFIYSENGHICNPGGKLITYRRKRTYPEYEVYVRATRMTAAETVQRAARSILRIKGRTVKVWNNIQTSASHTVLELIPAMVDNNCESQAEAVVITGENGKTSLFDSMLEAQADFQQNSKNDPAWLKTR